MSDPTQATLICSTSQGAQDRELTLGEAGPTRITEGIYMTAPWLLARSSPKIPLNYMGTGKTPEEREQEVCE